MKLKKIASLALAGVMAVSMLAGCATKAPTQDDNKTEVETTSLSKAVGDLMKDVPSYVTFEDKDSLSVGLQKAVEYVAPKDVVGNYINANTLQTASMLSAANTGITVSSGITYANIGTQATLEAAEKKFEGKATMDDAVSLDLTCISSEVDAGALKQLIASRIEASVKAYQYAMKSGSNNQVNGAFKYNYTVSVSTCTKAVNSTVTGSQTSTSGSITGAADPSVTFVAIQVVRTATHY